VTEELFAYEQHCSAADIYEVKHLYFIENLSDEKE